MIKNALKYPISLDYSDFYVSFLYDKKRMQMEKNGGEFELKDEEFQSLCEDQEWVHVTRFVTFSK